MQLVMTLVNTFKGALPGAFAAVLRGQFLMLELVVIAEHFHMEEVSKAVWAVVTVQQAYNLKARGAQFCNIYVI